MSDTIASLRGTIGSAADLQSVIRAMKALAASSIEQYKRSVVALADYYRTVELGLGSCLHTRTRALDGAMAEPRARTDAGAITAVVFGSDQGLVGRFNDVVADDAVKALAVLPGSARVRVWSVGERVHARLADAGLAPVGVFEVPSSVGAIASLVEQIVVETEMPDGRREASELHLFYNHSTSAASYATVHERLLPLDDGWRRRLSSLAWPTKQVPEIIGDSTATLRAFIREYLFVSLFRTCAESLACENASRLAAMERANKNIDELLEQLQGKFHRLRQSGIDEELFDVVAGFEALTSATQPRR